MVKKVILSVPNPLEPAKRDYLAERVATHLGLTAADVLVLNGVAVTVVDVLDGDWPAEVVTSLTPTPEVKIQHPYQNDPNAVLTAGSPHGRPHYESWTLEKLRAEATARGVQGVGKLDQAALVNALLPENERVTPNDAAIQER